MTNPVNILFAGSSFSVLSDISYNQQVRNWLVNQPVYEPIFATVAAGGAKTWYNLMQLSTYLTPSLQTIILDTANDDTANINTGCIEAFIRRVWAYNPSIRIIGMGSPSWNTQDISNDALAPTPTNLAGCNAAKAIFQYYCSFADYLARIVSLVGAGTYHLNDLVSVDTVHPSAMGYAQMALLAEVFLPFAGGQAPTVMPARLNAAATDFEQMPIIKNGTAYDSRTGTWADNGTSTSSSTPDSTIAFFGTFRSIGCYRADGTYPNVSVSIDGGDYIDDFAFYANGYDLGARAAHTVTIKVATTCKIDEFWAI
jgi:hypothetical protein